jgi:hypothetical protein
MKKLISLIYTLSLIEFSYQQNPINVPVYLTDKTINVNNPIV